MQLTDLALPAPTPAKQSAPRINYAHHRGVPAKERSAFPPTSKSVKQTFLFLLRDEDFNRGEMAWYWFIQPAMNLRPGRSEFPVPRSAFFRIREDIGSRGS
jgi:hypothetical protein